MRKAEELMEAASEMCDAVFPDHGGIQPHVLTLCKHPQTGESTIAYLKLDMPKDRKDAVAEGIRAALAKLQAEAYVFVAEAYITTIDLKVGTRPVKREIVTMSAEDELGVMQGSREILRQGMKPTLGPLVKLPTGDVATGRFMAMLPPRGKPT